MQQVARKQSFATRPPGKAAVETDSGSARRRPQRLWNNRPRMVGAMVRRLELRGIKVVHTLAWFSIESCVLYVLWAGFRRQSDSRVAVAAGVVATESLIFAGNRFQCPLTQLAERVGAERGSVTDIYLPRWFAHNLPALHVPLLLLAGYLHGRNLRGRSPRPADGHSRAV
jgi:hypothetical protein